MATESMNEESQILNLSDIQAKRRLLTYIGRLQGVWEVKLKERKPTRSLSQNAYYHTAVVRPFRDWLAEEWQENISHEQAHELLKHKILGTNERQIDGEVIEIPPTTTTLDTAEFSEYIEKCARWLAEFAGIVVVPSEMYFEGATEGKPQ